MKKSVAWEQLDLPFGKPPVKSALVVCLFLFGCNPSAPVCAMKPPLPEAGIIFADTAPIVTEVDIRLLPRCPYPRPIVDHAPVEHCPF